MKNENYYIGLDIGTNSVGFAVTDEEYNVIKKGQKKIIGIRLFEEGKTAEERRSFRSNRRRYMRKKERVELLKNIFSEEVAKIDKAFFQRLQESMYHIEDKKEYQSNSLFNDKDFSDKQYHEKYPTIYHLRRDLMTREIRDVRLVYLGIEHIIKNRGHFLFEGQDLNSASKFDGRYKSLNECLMSNYEELELKIEDMYTLEGILKDKTKSMTQKESEIIKLMSEKPNVKQKYIIKLMLGGSVDLKKLFDLESVDKYSVSFKDAFDEKYEEVKTVIDENIVLVECLKAIYDWIILSDILDVPNAKKEVSLSDAKIYQYDEHREDLKALKQMIKEYIPKEFRRIFINANEKYNYPAYIGMTTINGKKVVLKEKKCLCEDFNKFVYKMIENIEIDKTYEEIIKKLKEGRLLQKQRIKDNGLIPFQLHFNELEKIIENSKKNFEFFNNKDDEGYTVEEKIKSIFKYKIPYYVGPLNSHSEFSWVVRKQDKIYPWNFDEIVDKEASAEQFILRMTNKCTYLRDKDVIPKKSLLYTKFTVLNELNNLKLNGEDINVELKKDIFNNLFKVHKKVTGKKLKEYLVKNSIADKDVTITGIDGDFASSLDSYIAFTEVFGSIDGKEEMIENIIRWKVLFSEDKKMVESKIRANYSISDDEINKIKKLKFADWGRLSKEFLCDIYATNKETGELVNIIDAMYETNLNLMELLSDDLEYKTKLKEIYNEKDKDTIEYSDVEELYCSPAVKKSIWQSVQIVQEIEKIMGKSPKRLFIEVTRSEEKTKKRKDSRHKNLTELYKTIGREYADIIEQLSTRNDADLRQKKLYLYFTQLGKCAYTGRDISMDDLVYKSDSFDIEHIYPRSKTKDDSIHNNLVLVYKTANAKKSNDYPIPNEFRQETLWRLWHSKGLINKEKYERLVRNTVFTETELKSFINRQLVETSQSSKAVAELFERYFKNKDSKVIYSKAGNVTDFRQEYREYIVKSRDVNDFHHAHDAYLNIVVGNCYYNKFTTQYMKTITNKEHTINPKQIYKNDIKNGEKIYWKKGEEGTIKTVLNELSNKRILFTRQAFIQKGELFNQTIYKKGEGEFCVKNTNDDTKQISKLKDLFKYGSFKSINGSYFCVVEHKIKGKLNRTIEYVPIYLVEQIKQDKYNLEKYLLEKLELIEPKLIVRELKINSLLNIDGMFLHLSGRTGDRIVYKNAVQLHLDIEDMKYMKKVCKISEKLKQNNNFKVTEFDKVTKEKNIEKYKIFIKKLEDSIYSIFLKTQAVTLNEKIDIFKDLSVENQCIALSNILVIFKCNATKADFAILNGAKAVGDIKFSKNITNRGKAILINQSITGVYENQIDLLK